MTKRSVPQGSLPPGPSSHSHADGFTPQYFFPVILNSQRLPTVASHCPRWKLRRWAGVVVRGNSSILGPHPEKATSQGLTSASSGVAPNETEGTCGASGAGAGLQALPEGAQTGEGRRARLSGTQLHGGGHVRSLFGGQRSPAARMPCPPLCHLQEPGMGAGTEGLALWVGAGPAPRLSKRKGANKCK